MTGAPECCFRFALWAAVLCAMGTAAALVAVLPGDGEGSSAGLAAGIALGLLAAAVWCAGAACGVW